MKTLQLWFYTDRQLREGHLANRNVPNGFSVDNNNNDRLTAFDPGQPG